MKSALEILTKSLAVYGFRRLKDRGDILRLSRNFKLLDGDTVTIMLTITTTLSAQKMAYISVYETQYRGRPVKSYQNDIIVGYNRKNAMNYFDFDDLDASTLTDIAEFTVRFSQIADQRAARLDRERERALFR